MVRVGVILVLASRCRRTEEPPDRVDTDADANPDIEEAESSIITEDVPTAADMVEDLLTARGHIKGLMEVDAL